MKRIIIVTLVVFGFVSQMDAQWWWGKKKVNGNGKVITEERKTGDYDKVSLAGSWYVELVAGEEGRISIEGEENIIPMIVTEVEGRTLKVYTKKGSRFSTSRKLVITVPFRDLEALSVSGSGSIVAKDRIESEGLVMSLTGSGDIDAEIKTENLKGKVSGSGDLELTGFTENAYMSVTGSGDVDARHMEATNVEASVTGSGDIVLIANETIDAKVVGSGDIIYYGDPSNVKIKTTGSGDITSKK